MTPSQFFVRLPIVTWLQFLYDAGRNAGDDCARRHVLRHHRARPGRRRPSRPARHIHHSGGAESVALNQTKLRAKPRLNHQSFESQAPAFLIACAKASLSPAEPLPDARQAHFRTLLRESPPASWTLPLCFAKVLWSTGLCRFALQKSTGQLGFPALCPGRGTSDPCAGSLETAPPSRVNFRQIHDPGYRPARASKKPPRRTASKGKAALRSR